MSPAANTESASSLHREVTVRNRQGVHARPSASFVKLASQFQSDVFIEKDGETINGKSIMGLLMLAAGPGSRLRIVCNGPDARTALEELCALVDAKFGED
jgi:phosphocarrier protein HPr